MTFSVRYVPLVEAFKKNNFDIFVQVSYKMFPEMEDEFDAKNFKE